ncbi:MAG: hypothetical protein EOP62_11525 [Sphingomonadales bacterium]|nr:MAG: hypothetical protein EOP62_11525 [Sphingomonadales bacterium]
MAAKEKLLEAVNALEDALARSAKLGEVDFDAHRKDAVELRRLIAAQNSAIASLGDDAFETPESRQAFRNEFSKMRSAMAFHQASWPVVSVDRENPSYVASLRSIRETNRIFITWVRSALAKP